MTTTETLREACPTCDRVECKTLDRGAKDFWADKWARDECREHAVDWRKRALAAEATHVAAPAAIGINVLRFAPAGPVTITAPQRNDLLRMIDDAESRLRTLTTEASAGTGGEPTVWHAIKQEGVRRGDHWIRVEWHEHPDWGSGVMFIRRSAEMRTWLCEWEEQLDETQEWDEFLFDDDCVDARCAVVPATWRISICPACRGGRGAGIAGYSECSECAGRGYVVDPRREVAT